MSGVFDDAHGIGSGGDGAATLDNDTIAVDDLRLRLGRKRVAPTKIGEHPLMWREFANAGIAPLGFAPLHPQAISLALVAAADLRAVQRSKFSTAFRANARVHRRSPSGSGPTARTARTVQYAAKTKSPIASQILLILLALLGIL